MLWREKYEVSGQPPFREWGFVGQGLPIPGARDKFNHRQLSWPAPCFQITWMASVRYECSSFSQSPPLPTVFCSVLFHSDVVWTLKDMPWRRAPGEWGGTRGEKVSQVSKCPEKMEMEVHLRDWKVQVAKAWKRPQGSTLVCYIWRNGCWEQSDLANSHN